MSLAAYGFLDDLDTSQKGEDLIFKDSFFRESFLLLSPDMGRGASSYSVFLVTEDEETDSFYCVSCAILLLFLFTCCISFCLSCSSMLCTRMSTTEGETVVTVGHVVSDGTNKDGQTKARKEEV